MALTRCSAVEAADYGVRINAVSPSIARHPFLAKVTSDELLDELAANEAYGRAAEVWGDRRHHRDARQRLHDLPHR